MKQALTILLLLAAFCGGCEVLTEEESKFLNLLADPNRKLRKLHLEVRGFEPKQKKELAKALQGLFLLLPKRLQNLWLKEQKNASDWEKIRGYLNAIDHSLVQKLVHKQTHRKFWADFAELFYPYTTEVFCAENPKTRKKTTHIVHSRKREYVRNIRKISAFLGSERLEKLIEFLKKKEPRIREESLKRVVRYFTELQKLDERLRKRLKIKQSQGFTQRKLHESIFLNPRKIKTTLGLKTKQRQRLKEQRRDSGVIIEDLFAQIDSNADASQIYAHFLHRFFKNDFPKSHLIHIPSTEFLSGLLVSFSHKSLEDLDLKRLLEILHKLNDLSTSKSTQDIDVMELFRGSSYDLHQLEQTLRSIAWIHKRLRYKFSTQIIMTLLQNGFTPPKSLLKAP